MFFGMMSFKAFTRIAFIMALIAWPCSWLFSLDAKNIANLALTEHEAAALQEKLAFSDAVVTVVTRAGGDIALATLLVSCPGATTTVLAHEARKTKVHSRTFHVPPTSCAPGSFSQDARILWEGVSGGNLDWFVDAGLRTIVRWLEAAQNFSETGRDPLGPQTAAEMAAGLVASSSRLRLRFAFALHRAFGVLSTMHGCMGELGLVPPEVDFRALVASRDGSYVLAVVDLMGAHASFWWGDQISSAMSASKQQQQQCRVVFKRSDEEKCRWWHPLCRLRRLVGVEERNAARETTCKEQVEAAKRAKREEKRKKKERERQVRKEKKRLSSERAQKETLESIENDPNSWIPRWG